MRHRLRLFLLALTLASGACTGTFPAGQTTRVVDLPPDKLTSQAAAAPGAASPSPSASAPSPSPSPSESASSSATPTPSVAPAASPTPTPSPAASPVPDIVVTPSTLTFLEIAGTLSFTVSQVGFDGPFTVPAVCITTTGFKMATIAPGADAKTFVVTPVGSGGCQVNIRGQGTKNGLLVVEVTRTALIISSSRRPT